MPSLFHSSRTLSLRRPHMRPKTRPTRPPTRVQNAWVDATSVIGHGVIYFTFFYCTLNWYTYRQTRLRIEQAKRDQQDKKNQQESKNNKNK